jgi:hypothetical protein
VHQYLSCAGFMPERRLPAAEGLHKLGIASHSQLVPALPARTDTARDQLRHAYEIFDSAGAEAFAERAPIELRACGGQAREHVPATADTLTVQEALIARRAGDGASNPQIAAQLFISPPPSPTTCGRFHQARRHVPQPACLRALGTARHSTVRHVAHD